MTRQRLVLFVEKQPTLNSLSLTCGRYLQLLRAGVMTNLAHIYVTELDKTRLESLLACEIGSANIELGHEIERDRCRPTKGPR